jgi:hypothetical protein
MRMVGWFQVVVGTSMLLLWSVLLATGQVSEIQDGRTDIWFHISAEVVAAALLLAGGTALLRGRGAPSHAARLLAGFAAGALLYTAVNSAGYYAESGDWAMVAMFAVVAVGTVAAVWRLFRIAPSPAPRPLATARSSGTTAQGSPPKVGG